MADSKRSTEKDYVQTQIVTTQSNERNEPREQYIWSRVWKERLYDETKKRVMLIGDSIIEGYSYFVAEELKEDYIVSRWTNSLAIDNRFAISLMEFALLSDEKIKYDVIHFTHGGHGKWTTADKYEKAYDTTIKKLIEFCPESRIIIATPTEYCNAFTQGTPTVNETATALLAERAEIAKKIALRYGLEVNDMFAVSQKHRTLHSEDGVHYTDDGYYALAQSVAKAVRGI